VSVYGGASSTAYSETAANTSSDAKRAPPASQRGAAPPAPQQPGQAGAVGVRDRRRHPLGEGGQARLGVAPAAACQLLAAETLTTCTPQPASALTALRPRTGRHKSWEATWPIHAGDVAVVDPGRSPVGTPAWSRCGRRRQAGRRQGSRARAPVRVQVRRPRVCPAGRSGTGSEKVDRQEPANLPRRPQRTSAKAEVDRPTEWPPAASATVIGEMTQLRLIG